MLITVFTPAYNRADLLPRLYASLRRQTFRDFEWLIVDDGSTDDTAKLVEGYIDEKEVDIVYVHKQNGGKHTAINLGAKQARGELFFIVDSDDELPEQALQDVVDVYVQVRGNKTFAGVAGLDMYAGGKIVGTGLHEDVVDCNALDIRYRHHVNGDLKEVFLTRVIREFPFPEIKGERFCPEALVWNRIATKYKLRYFNRPIYIAEYQADGITAGITRARMLSPIASMMTYAELSALPIPLLQRVKAAVNYWRFRCCWNGAASGNVPRLSWLWWWAMPLGGLMHLRDRIKVK